MINLIKNELIKIYAKSGFVLVILTIIVGIVMAPFSSEIMEANDGAFYVYNLAGSLPMINLFAIIVSSTIFNTEISSSTIKFLLLRPHSRTSIILSKMMAVFANSIILSICLFLSTVIASFIFFEENSLLTSFQAFSYNNALFMALMSIISNFLLIAFYISLMFLLSVLFKSQMITSIVGYICIFSSMLVNVLTLEIFENHSLVQWNPFNLLNFRESFIGADVIHVGNLSPVQMGLGLVAYIVVMFLATNNKFRKLDIE